MANLNATEFNGKPRDLTCVTYHTKNCWYIWHEDIRQPGPDTHRSFYPTRIKGLTVFEDLAFLPRFGGVQMCSNIMSCLRSHRKLLYISCMSVIVELIERLKKKKKKEQKERGVENCFPNSSPLLSLPWSTERSQQQKLCFRNFLDQKCGVWFIANKENQELWESLPVRGLCSALGQVQASATSMFPSYGRGTSCRIFLTSNPDY